MITVTHLIHTHPSLGPLPGDVNVKQHQPPLCDGVVPALGMVFQLSIPDHTKSTSLGIESYSTLRFSLLLFFLFRHVFMDVFSTCFGLQLFDAINYYILLYIFLWIIFVGNLQNPTICSFPARVVPLSKARCWRCSKSSTESRSSLTSFLTAVILGFFSTVGPPPWKPWVGGGTRVTWRIFWSW